MNKPNGRFEYSEFQKFIEVFECVTFFTKKNNVKAYQVCLKKSPNKIIAEFLGDSVKGFKLRIMP